MLVFVDTSVWIDFFRDADTPLTARLRTLIDSERVAVPAPVRLEILSGVSASNWSLVVEALDPLRVSVPRDSTWALVESWMAHSTKSGHRFGIIDMLIGAGAAEQGGAVWSLDRDFARMERLGFVKCFEPGEIDV